MNREIRQKRKYPRLHFPSNAQITKYGVNNMPTETIKKTSRGMRKHVRRMKQESRKAGIPINELKKRMRSPQVPKVKKEA